MDPLSILLSLVSFIRPLLKYLFILYTVLLPFIWIGMFYSSIDFEKGIVFNVLLIFTGLNPLFLFVFFKWVLKKTFFKSLLFIFLILLCNGGIIYGLQKVELFNEYDQFLILGGICIAIDLGITIIAIHTYINLKK